MNSKHLATAHFFLWIIVIWLGCSCWIGRVEAQSVDGPSGALDSTVVADLPSLANLPAIAPLQREYRGVWVATVANIDWPSKPGLPVSQQQAEAIKLLDLAVELKLNVIVLQVRTSCDALYASQLEPWSYFLTGSQGVAPEPFYDPLEFWIDQAHARGLELHAWFNPFRARNTGQSYAESATHISQTQPELVKRYGNDKTSYLWLDPGEAASREHSLNVFLDVLQRYDVDGIHIDDYFYPYPVDDIAFPDDPAWQKYQAQGGQLSRDDWRRDSMNRFIQQLYAEIKRFKPHVKFGISPFGIWKPGHPPSVAGFSQHDKLYADARLWLNEGWCDYYAPQLYWAISARQQSFPALLNWWSQENLKKRHLVPGIYTSRIGSKSSGYTAGEVINQTVVARYTQGSSGVIHFSMKALQENRESINDQLQQNVYNETAVLPALDWISRQSPTPPQLDFQKTAGGWQASWKATSESEVRFWRWCVLQNGRWQQKIIPARQLQINSDGSTAEAQAVAVSAIDLYGNESKLSIATR